MPDLAQSLQGRDLGHLRIVADLWGIELNAPDARVGLLRLAPALLDKKRIREGVAGLPAGAREALDDLYQNDGRLPWPLFTRRYGAVREMGAGRRDRERPYLKSASAAEALWYRALVARSFFDTPTGAQEFAYIPDDLLPLLPVPQDLIIVTLGRPATAAERAHPILAEDAILDRACTLLAALRLGLDPQASLAREDQEASALPLMTAAALRLLLACAGLVDDSVQPQPEPTRLFLEAGRGEALAMLVKAWLESTLFNDLRLVPGLQAEGEWQNDPLRARRAILGFLGTVPGFPKGAQRPDPAEGKKSASARPANRPYWNLDSFVAAIRLKQPDFQRPAGDYDSWFIRDQQTSDFLRGFEHWEAVDGALLRYVITGPLHWLGILDLAAPEPGGPASAFRFSAWAAALLEGAAPEGLRAEDEPVQISSNGKLRLSRYTSRAVRYQIARFCAWEGEKDGIYHYRLTPASLARARQQGLTVTHLFTLLGRSGQALPPNLANALRRWEGHGAEARLEPVFVLRLSSPDLLQKLRSSRAARFLGDPLGPTAVIVKPGAGPKVMDVLAELGYLGEYTCEGHEPENAKE